jgi:cytochrome c oxidase cbb3-type subunit III
MSEQEKSHSSEAEKAEPRAGAETPWWEGPLQHDYDGIQEANVAPPRWWQGIFLVTVLAAGVYWFVFHTFHFAPVGRAEYEKEAAQIAAAQAEKLRAMGTIGPEALDTLAKDPVTLEKGQATFTAMCAPCHKPDGSGLIGPNLTDSAWLHGGSNASIYKTITDGVPDKGMQAWLPTLGPDKTLAVTAYVLTLRGKNLPGKPPQGTPDP